MLVAFTKPPLVIDGEERHSKSPGFDALPADTAEASLWSEVDNSEDIHLYFALGACRRILQCTGPRPDGTCPSFNEETILQDAQTAHRQAYGLDE